MQKYITGQEKEAAQRRFSARCIDARQGRVVASANDVLLANVRPPVTTLSQNKHTRNLRSMHVSACCLIVDNGEWPSPIRRPNRGLDHSSWAVERQDEFAHAEVAASRSGPGGRARRRKHQSTGGNARRPLCLAVRQLGPGARNVCCSRAFLSTMLAYRSSVRNQRFEPCAG